MNEAIKKISLNMKYSYLVIAKDSILNDGYNNIREALFVDFKKIK